MSGIYAICRRDSDECYIGSAVSISKRWREHRNDMIKGKHHSPRLQRVHDKCGMGILEFVIIETVADKATLIEREQVWLDRFDPVYNTAKVAGSILGVKFGPQSQAIRAAISAALTGKKRTAEQCANISSAKRGRALPPRTPEHCAATSRALTGRKHSPERSAAKSARMKGNRLTPETRARMSAAKMGNTSAAGNKGQKHTPERIAARVAAIVAGIAAARARVVRITAAPE